jgi:uncharacterized protein YvpB
MLNVPFIPQWGVGANRAVNDCGVACVAMLLSYYGKLGGRTVDMLTRQTGLASSDSGLLPMQLVVLASRYGLPLKVNAGTTLDQIRAEIDAGRPVIALVSYRYILGRLDQADSVPGKDLHFFVILGYDDTHFIANDPDTWVDYERYGHNDMIPVTELDKAITGASYHNQSVFVGEVVMTPLEQAKSLAAQLGAVLNTVKEAPVVQLPPTTPMFVTDIGVRGRAGPGLTYAILKLFQTGDQVGVLEETNGWKHVLTPVDCWISSQYLSVTRPL